MRNFAWIFKFYSFIQDIFEHLINISYVLGLSSSDSVWAALPPSRKIAGYGTARIKSLWIDRREIAEQTTQCESFHVFLQILFHCKEKLLENNISRSKSCIKPGSYFGLQLEYIVLPINELQLQAATANVKIFLTFLRTIDCSCSQKYEPGLTPC